MLRFECRLGRAVYVYALYASAMRSLVCASCSTTSCSCSFLFRETAAAARDWLCIVWIVVIVGCVSVSVSVKV